MLHWVGSVNEVELKKVLKCLLEESTLVLHDLLGVVVAVKAEHLQFLGLQLLRRLLMIALYRQLVKGVATEHISIFTIDITFPSLLP